MAILYLQNPTSKFFDVVDNNNQYIYIETLQYHSEYKTHEQNQEESKVIVLVYLVLYQETYQMSQNVFLYQQMHHIQHPEYNELVYLEDVIFDNEDLLVHP